MPEPPTWPPPPNTPEPLSTHDDFLIACIRNWTPKRPILRLQLAGKLCGETGIGFSSCLAVVNNFCDRYAILVSTHGLIVWSPFLLHFTMLAMLDAMNYVLDQRHDAAITHIERVMLTVEKRHLDFMFISVWAMAIVASLIWAFFRDKKTRRQAVEAKEKFA